MALIAGPTASGKSALALALAERLPATIVNADSAQVYGDLRVLSARPSIEEEARAPHALFGYIDGAEACSAARWAADARRAIADSTAAGSLPILVGGTGLYLRTLLNGIAPIPDIDPDVRAAVRALPVADAHQALSREDPAAAARLAPADTTRVARALEVIRSTGRTIAAWQTDLSGGIGDRIRLTPLLLLPPRDWLQRRCDERFVTMLETGGIEEAEALAARDLDPALPVMRAIGVPDIIAWRKGDIDRETMIVRAQTATRQYAKRQYTWFSRQPPAGWPRAVAQLNGDDIVDLAIKLANEALTL
ncbi:tRNA dimethylallyltransferase [Sphingomonas zeicaulis]